MEGQRHKNPLTRVAFVYNGPKGMELAPNPRYSGGSKALGGSFKLVTAVPKPVREMIQLPRETQKDGDTQTNQRTTNEYTKYKPRLNTQKNTLVYELVLVAVHMENFQCTN